MSLAFVKADMQSAKEERPSSVAYRLAPMSQAGDDDAKSWHGFLKGV